MRPMDLVKLMAKSTVSQMLERKDFRQRFESEKPIFQHEFLYPLLQAYDSVALDCDVELGGSDQLFNLLVGRDLMPQYGLQPQIVMTMPLLEGIAAKIDETGQIVGEKMSKSADNYVGIDEPAEEQVRKIMLVDDRVIFRYFELLSARPRQEIADMDAEIRKGRHPKEIKKIFAREIVAQYHGESAVEGAIAAWESKFEGTEPLDVPLMRVTSQSEKLWLPKALALAKLVASTSQGKTLVEQGGVEVDQVKVKDPKFELEVGRSYVVRVGSKNRKFVRLEVLWQP
jgi:tyrosyl-tRNA synthetase